MPKRKIAPMEINGKTVMVEIDDIEIIEPALPSSSNQPSDLRETATPTGVTDTVKEKLADAAETLEAVVGAIEHGLDRLKPKEWTVEVNIGFAGEKKIPYLAKGEVSSGIKVSAKWVNQD